MTQQLCLFETTQPQKKTAQRRYRIVIIDGHIIAQFYTGPKGFSWWTCYKGKRNDESDYAVWEETSANLKEAVKLVGENAPIIRSDLHPVQQKGGWATGLLDDLHVYPSTPEGYRQALRELAFSVE